MKLMELMGRTRWRNEAVYEKERQQGNKEKGEKYVKNKKSNKNKNIERNLKKKDRKKINTIQKFYF